MNMGPHRKIRGTYSKVRQSPATEEDRRKQYRQRRAVPQFDNLFLPKDENRDTSSTRDPFDSLIGEVKKAVEPTKKEPKSKPFRRPLAVNSLLTNSTFGSAGHNTFGSADHNSTNDTFDKIVGRNNRFGASTYQVCNGALSTSGSSFDTTGILYQSLRSHTESHLHCSLDDRQKLRSIKREVDSSKRDPGQPSVIFEDGDCIATVKKKSCIKDVKSQVLSPQLFSSGDEKLDGETKAKKPKKRKSKVSRKSRKSSKSGTRTRRKNGSGKRSDFTDDSRLKGMTDGIVSCNDFPTRHSDNPRFKRPSVIIGQTNSLSASSDCEEKIVLSPNLSPQTVKGFTGTPGGSNLAKAILIHQLVSSQSRLSATSPFSCVSQGSAKSSVKSDALTSTPADTSRVKSLTNSFGLWNVQDDVLSPVPRESSSISAVKASSAFESLPADSLKIASLSNQKSGSNPSHGSCYHSCVSGTCGTSDCAKASRSPSSSKDCNTGSGDYKIITDGGEPQNYYNSSLELRSGPFKGVIIPMFDPTGSVQTVSPKGHSSPVYNELPSIIELPSTQTQSEAQTSPEQSAISRNFTATSQESFAAKKGAQVSGGKFLQDMATNFSSEKLKQINSFLNRQSFSVSARTRQQKRKFSKNKVEPVPLVKRLTRRTARTLKLQTNRTVADAEESSYMSQKENVNTDQSTTTEPSFVLPRRKRLILKNCFGTWLQSGLRTDANSSSDSVISNDPLMLARGSGSTYNAESCFVKPSPVFLRRTSVRLASKRITVKRTNAACSCCKDVMSKVEDTSYRLFDKAHVSTRSAARRLQNAKKLSIMQFSLSSVKDHEESKCSIASKNVVSDSDSAYSTTEKDPGSSRNEMSQPGDSHCKSSILQSLSLKSEYLENQVIKEEAEDSVICDDASRSFVSEDSQVRSSFASSINSRVRSSFASSINSQVKSSFTSSINSRVRSSFASSVKVNELSFRGDEEESNLDISLDDVFELPFQAAIPTKRGKGWIRSLSIARASIIGSEYMKAEGVRRQTVHRMSIGGRRVTRLRISGLSEMTVNCIKEMEESASQDEDILSQSIISDPRRHVLALCSQTETLPISDCFTESRLSCCKKIGEGVFGEVFMTKPDPNSMDNATVLKIMPIEGDFDVNGETQKKFGEILSEIIISLELSNLRSTKEKHNWTENFVHVLNCWCVEGSYHQDMLQLWDLYHEEKGSENDRPDLFPESQLYIVLEFTHGGRDLESFVFNNAGQSLAVFLQIAYSLAVAEQELEFEHRDLHWGNVLVAVTKESCIEFKLNDGTYTLQTQGVKATVIDFTLSRLKAPHCVMYNNLAEDPSLFTAEGDYQFEIYRQMKKSNRNEWQSFTPYTNVLWLHYILDKMINECYYKNVKTKVHKTNLDQLDRLKETLLQSESAMAFVLRREHDIE